MNIADLFKNSTEATKIIASPQVIVPMSVLRHVLNTYEVLYGDKLYYAITAPLHKAHDTVTLQNSLDDPYEVHQVYRTALQQANDILDFNEFLYLMSAQADKDSRMVSEAENQVKL